VDVEELRLQLPPAARESASIECDSHTEDGVGNFPQRVEEIQPLRHWRTQQVQAYVKHVLQLCGGNVTRTSELLGIDRTTLYSYTLNVAERKLDA
jgi:transcriptional regulator of acetoin/glycerol metabolism